MGNKTTDKQSDHSPCLATHMGGVNKRSYEAKTSRVGRKAREIMRKNFMFFSKGSEYSKHINTNVFTSSTPFRITYNEEYDALFHQAVRESQSQDKALPTVPTGEAEQEETTKSWKKDLERNKLNCPSLTETEIKYQELIYEFVLTEQTYVDDLILVYKIFIKDTSNWDGLHSAVRNLFEILVDITRLHLQLLKDLRDRQATQHPVVKSITDICRELVPKLSVYASYFSSFEKANNLINESIRMKDPLGSFISHRSLWAECRNLPFSAFLLTPIQRIMKYPLFFKALSECLKPSDPEQTEIRLFLDEMEVTLRYFETRKKESEDFLKLEDLASRIKGLEGSTIRIAEQGRKLIYEGYLSIVPTVEQSRVLSFSDSHSSFTSTIYTPTLNRKTSSFSLASKKPQRTYVFLFNDMIVCTRERDKKKVYPTEFAAQPCRKGSFYGPSADTLFKITHTPGKITHVEKAVTREVSANDKPSRRGSALFQSFRRYGSRTQDDHGETNSIPPSPAVEPHRTSYFSSQSCNDIYGSQKSNVVLEKHPLQFICSIATRNLVTIQFETDTPEEKESWCHHMETVLEEHVQRNKIQTQSKRVSLSPTHSTFSIDSLSSIESTPNVAAWTGFGEVDKMEVDEFDPPFSISEPPTNVGLVTQGSDTIDRKSQELLQTIMNEFDDSIWGLGTTAGLSPCQLRQSFSNI